MKISGSLILTFILQLWLLTGCQKSDQGTDCIQFSKKQIAAIEIGFATGTKANRIIFLPAKSRNYSFSGIAYDSNAILSLLYRLDINEQKAKAMVMEIDSAFAEENQMIGYNKLIIILGSLNEQLNSRKEELPSISNSLRMGFILGEIIEEAAIVLYQRPSEEQLAKEAELIQLKRADLAGNVGGANLPNALLNRLLRMNLEINTVIDLRDLRDRIYEFWDTSRKLDLRTSCQERQAVPSPKLTQEHMEPGWSKHVHPRGFTFLYPTEWTVQDDKDGKIATLLPPGVNFTSPGKKAFFMIVATPFYSDPFALQGYWERQYVNKTEIDILRYTQESFNNGIGPGAILDWEYDYLKNRKTRLDSRMYVVIVNNWAIHVDTFGPKSMTRIHDDTIRKVVASFRWENRVGYCVLPTLP